MARNSVFPSIASVLAQNVDSKDQPLNTSSDPLSVWVEWAREWVKIHTSVQSSVPLPNAFEQAFTVTLNTKDINPDLHIPEHTQEEQETATINTAQVAQALQVQAQVQVKLHTFQVSNPACCSLAPISGADTNIPAFSLPPSVLPIILVTPASPLIAATSAPTHKQASSISAPKGKYLSVPEWNYITNMEARSARRKELAKKTKEKKAREEKRAARTKRWPLKLKSRFRGWKATHVGLLI